MDNFHDLVEEASNITSSANGVDYNDDYNHKYDYIMSLLLVFGIQEFNCPPLNAIVVFGADGVAKAGCGGNVAISATGCHSVRTIVSEGQAPSASDYNFNI